MRRFVRHPSEIPIDVVCRGNGKGANGDERGSVLKDISLGGLSFCVDQPLPIGSKVDLSIPSVLPSYHSSGIVVWCEPSNSHFDIGVQFIDTSEAYKTRMVEQVCQIEHYRHEIETSEGRVLNSEQAALEWIEKHAAEFARDFQSPYEAL